MSVEYAVLDQDGNQMGMPTRSWTTADPAFQFKRTLEQARARAIGEGQSAETVLASGAEMNSQQRQELEDAVTKGKRAAVATYSIFVREVGPWRTI